MKKIISIILALSLLLPGLMTIAVNASDETAAAPAIERIEAVPVTIIEGTNQITESQLDKETGEWTEYTRYEYGIDEFTVYFTDGTSQVCYGCLEYDGGYYYPEMYYDGQSPDNVWASRRN